MTKLRLVLCLVAAMSVPATAWGQAKCKTAQGKDLWVEGVKAYNVQKYDDAIRHWEAAYLECDDPELLFNLAQANRKGKHYERARDLYKAWLRDPRTKDDADRKLVKKKIAELDELIAKQEQNIDSPPEGVRPKEGTDAITTETPTGTTEPVAKPEEGSAGQTGSPTPPGTEPSPSTVAALEPVEPTPVRGEHRRWTTDKWGWILAGTGTVATLTGAGFVLWSIGIEDDARSSALEDEANRLFDDAETKRTIGAVTMVAGGVLLAGGIVHFALYSRSPRRARTSSITVGPTWIGVAWSF